LEETVGRITWHDFVVMPLTTGADKPGEKASFSDLVEACRQVGAATILEEIWEGSDSYLWKGSNPENEGVSLEAIL